MTIESILRRKGTDVTTIAPEASIKRAADWLRAKNIGALVVTSEDTVLGLISEREIVHAFSRYGETAGSMPVKEIMQYGVTTVSPDESVNRVMNLMTHHRVRHMPVLRGGKLAGIVSIGDVVKHRLEDLELETNVLRDVYTRALTARASALGVPMFPDLVPSLKDGRLALHAHAHLVISAIGGTLLPSAKAAFHVRSSGGRRLTGSGQEVRV